MSEESQAAHQLRNLKMSYRTIGRGQQAVLCLHGFPQTGRMWTKLSAALGDKYTLFAPDLRGAGESERPSGGYDKKTMAADVHELVGALGLDKVSVVGHDIGGMVAYALAAQWPETVEKLVIMEVLLPGFGLEQLFAIRKPGDFAHMPFFMAADLPEWLIAGRERAFFTWFMRRMVMNQAAFQDEELNSYAELFTRPGALRASFDTYRAFWQDAEDNKNFAEKQLSMPVLAVGGEFSVGDSLEQSLKPLARDLNGIVFKGAGHFVPDEQPTQLAAALTDFFTQ